MVLGKNMSKQKKILPSEKKHTRLVLKKSKTDPKYGQKPEDRSVEHLLKSSMIIIDKPNGPTSHQVDSWIKQIFKDKKIGHHGTLDPNATGVLPVGIGDAVKSLYALLPAGKEYVGIMKLHKDIDEEKIRKTCENFIGKISQMPPVRSAVKRRRRSREIYYLDIIDIDDRDVLFRVGCESGTYVRTLVVDIGRKLRCGAHLSDLRRTRVGNLNEKDSVFLQDVKDAFVFYKEDNDEKYLKNILQPVEKLIMHLPKIIILDSAVDSICHGANLAIPGIAEIDTDIKKDTICAVMTLKDEGVAIAKSLMSTEEIVQKKTGFCTDTQRVMMKKDRYPSVWKKS